MSRGYWAWIQPASRPGGGRFPDNSLPGGEDGGYPDHGFNPDYPDQGLPGGGGRPPRPGQGLPHPGRPVDPGWGWGGGGERPIDPGYGWGGGERPGHGLPHPGRPVDPGWGWGGGQGGEAGQLPVWPLGPEHGLPPIPGQPLPPIDPPPGTIWPPLGEPGQGLPPGVKPGKVLVLVLISGVGYRYVVLELKPDQGGPVAPDQGLPGGEDGAPDQGLPQAPAREPKRPLR
jgi:hypothetical protein